MKNFDIRDVFFTAGLAALCVGVGAYDWRLAPIVGGVLLLAFWAVPHLRRGGD